MGTLVLLFCRILGIFLIFLFIVLPLLKSLAKICYKLIKKEQKDIKTFIEREENERN